MRAGELRHRVEFGRYVTGEDPWGDPLPRQWQSTCTVWASVEALSGHQYFQSQQTVNQSDHRIRVRYHRDIEQGMIARHDGREFTVQAVLDTEGRRRELEVLCQEVRPA